MDWSVVAVVLATLLGPVAAVQAQKWIERRQVETRRKEEIFRILMATRSARVSPEHVRALNMIDLAFYGTPTPTGEPRRSKPDQEIMKAWREYYLQLDLNQDGWSDAQKTAWSAKADELFLNLLEKLAIGTNYRFDRERLRAAQYSPLAHLHRETQEAAARYLLLEVLAGRSPILVKAHVPPAPHVVEATAQPTPAAPTPAGPTA